MVYIHKAAPVGKKNKKTKQNITFLQYLCVCYLPTKMLQISGNKRGLLTNTARIWILCASY